MMSMTPVEVVASIEKSKSMIKGISKDQAMSTVFGVSFNMLKSLCTKEINEENLELELEVMERRRNESENQDSMRNIPLRRMIYELSKAINNTARVLAAKNSNAPSEEFDGESESTQVSVSQEGADDIASGSMTASACPVGFANTPQGHQMLGEVKEESAEDEVFANPQLLSPEELHMPKFEDEEGQGGSTADNFGMSHQMRGEVKDEPIDDFYQNSTFYSEEGLRMGKLEEEEEEEETIEDDSPYYPYNDMAQHVQPQYSLVPRRNPTSALSNPPTLICPLCGDYANKRVGRSLSGIKTHLSKFHSKTVLSANLRMDCVCGYSTQNLSHVACHGSYCAVNSFAMLKNQEKPGPPPLKTFRTETTVSWKENGSMDDPLAIAYICPFCPNIVKRTMRNLETHVRKRHNRTCKEAGLTFLCACGYISRSVADVMKHKKKCAPNNYFTMRLPEA